VPLPFQQRLLRVMVVTVLRPLFQALLLCMREAEEVVLGLGPRRVQPVAQVAGATALFNLRLRQILMELLTQAAVVEVEQPMLHIEPESQAAQG
jgi:hypothetical protein